MKKIIIIIIQVLFIFTQVKAGANGVNVADMQNKLLQKIEELTLYMVQQQKQIEDLKAQVENNKH